MLKLCPFDELYLSKSLQWLNDEEIQQLIDSHVPVTKEIQRLWYDRIQRDTTFLIWGISYNDHPIGACGIKHIDNTKHVGEYWGYIGEKVYWGGKGHLILEQVYQKAYEIGLIQLNLSVLETNQRAIALYQKEGFAIDRSIEGKLYMRKKL